MDFLLTSAVLIVSSLIIIELFLYAYRNMRTVQRARIKKRLRKYTYVETGAGDIIKNRKLSDIALLNRILSSITVTKKLDHLIVQANVKQPVSIYILMALFLAAFGTLVSYILLENLTASIGIGCLLMGLPYVYLVHLKTKRAKKFQSQLHEGLDMIGRALRAGHSFTSSLKLAADEFEDPLGTEFEETLDEINFGVSVPMALRNLSDRVDCRELKFFVISVIIQRETGGNLAELIESLAHIVRERFRFEGNVRILSAEGKLSAVILIMIPFLIGGWLFLMSPGFIRPLIEEPIGRYMLGAAGIGMVVGSLVMKKMVNIDV